MGSHGCELNVDFLIFGSAVFLTVNCVCFELTIFLKSRVVKGGMTRAKLQKTLNLVKGILDYEDYNDVDIVIEVCFHVYSFFTSFGFQIPHILGRAYIATIIL
jgi:hypothetical protein